MLFAYRYPASHFLRMRVSGIIVTTKRSADRESPWKIPLLMGTVPKLWPFDVSSVRQLFMEYFRLHQII